MITLLSEIHFWTTQEDVIIKNTDYGSFKYYTKKDVSGESIMSQAKKEYCEQRNTMYHINNKRPNKLKDRLKELEEYLVHNKIVCYHWEENHLKLLLSTGLLVNLTINNRTGDLVGIRFDKQLSAKLQVNIICDGVIFGSQVICVCNDGHVLGFGGPWKDGWMLEGGPRRSLNYHKEWLVVWGKTSMEHPQPWTPLAKDHQRANLHLYWIGARDPELLAYKKTDAEPLQVVVSKFEERCLIMVEQKVTQRGAVSVEISNLELIGNNLKRISITSVPLQTQVSCTALSANEERLLIGCIDGTLALLDRNRGSTITVKASFIPTLATWHDHGALVAISNERGLLQYYDTALNCVKCQSTSEDCIPSAILDLSGYFNMQFSVASINWGPKDLIFSLEQGPLVLITHIDNSLTFKAITQRYIDMNKFDKAVKLLLSWEFNEASFFVLQKIVAELMRRQLNADVALHLTTALGSFHNAPVPLPTAIRHRFNSQVVSLTRRFFHQLVRANMYETAFLLAVDVGHHDLFMDLYYIAVKIGKTEMAAAARAQASALLSRCSSEASDCSRSSCSQCSATSSSSSDEDNLNSTNHDMDIHEPIVPLGADNVLTTNFNKLNPTTYNNTPPRPISDSLKVNYAPRATYVKAPLAPPNFTTKRNSSSPIPPIVPPLPFHSSLGIPFIPNTNSFNNSKTGYGPSNNSIYSAFSATNSFKLPHKLLPPPLPNVVDNNDINSDITSTISSTCAVASTCSKTSLASSKKNQAKVKFSDTVTAFIVPEVKRPVRPPPPAHVTDPQKELADSLPLCHPNEDYLKDFAPVRKKGEEDDEEEENDTGSERSSQPKIKVVHFGVV